MNLAVCPSCESRFLPSYESCPDCGQTMAADGWTTVTQDIAPGADDQTQTPADKIRSSIMTSEQIAGMKPPDPLIDGLLSLNSLAMLYGASGVGKSFVAEDFALHVANGKWWQGRRVQPGRVMYVVAEGAASFGPRLAAWKKHHQLAGEANPVAWVPRAVNLYEASWAGGLAEVVAEVKPALVVIDTFARCIVGAEENSSKDVGVIVAHLDHIRRAAGSCVLLVHHSGKDSAAGARGSSALKGAMDTELELTGDALYLQLRNTKQKDGPEAQPFPLRLREVAGTSSVVVDEGRADPGELPEKLAAVLEALMDADVPEGLPTSTWETVAGIPERTFHRHKAELLRRELVVNVSETKTPRYRPAPSAAVRVEQEKALDATDWDEV